MAGKCANNIKKGNFVYEYNSYSFLTSNHDKLGKNNSQKAISGA